MAFPATFVSFSFSVSIAVDDSMAWLTWNIQIEMSKPAQKIGGVFTV
jgi:hypothetical protein